MQVAAGVTLSYTDGSAKTATIAGEWELLLPGVKWLERDSDPMHPCYTFNPPNHDYSNVTTNQTTQNYTATFNPAAGCATIDVTIGGDPMGSYALSSNPSLITSYPNIWTDR